MQDLNGPIIGLKISSKVNFINKLVFIFDECFCSNQNPTTFTVASTTLTAALGETVTTPWDFVHENQDDWDCKQSTSQHVEIDGSSSIFSVTNVKGTLATVGSTQQADVGQQILTVKTKSMASEMTVQLTIVVPPVCSYSTITVGNEAFQNGDETSYIATIDAIEPGFYTDSSIGSTWNGSGGKRRLFDSSQFSHTFKA